MPRKMEPIEGSETSAFKPQTPGKYPKENIIHKEHGESLKSRQSKFCLTFWSRLRGLDKSEIKYQITRCRIPEKGKHHWHRRENPQNWQNGFCFGGLWLVSGWTIFGIWRYYLGRQAPKFIDAFAKLWKASSRLSVRPYGTTCLLDTFVLRISNLRPESVTLHCRVHLLTLKRDEINSLMKYQLMRYVLVKAKSATP